MIIGDNIYLRLMEKRDVAHKVKWINDSDIRKTLFLDDISEIGTEIWLQGVVRDSSRKDFIVCDIKDDRPIGFVSIVNIDYKNSKAETYLCIGDKEVWGQGIGYETKFLITDYIFRMMGLNKVYSYNWASNASMKRINEKIGFIKEGLLREDIFIFGEHRDRIIYSMLKKDFFDMYGVERKNKDG